MTLARSWLRALCLVVPCLVVPCLVVPCLVASAAAATSIPLDVRLSNGFVVPPPAGLEARLLDDAGDGRLNDVDLLTAALVASGVADVDVARERARVQRALAPAREAARTATSPRARGERLLRALHGTVLRRYRESQSRVDVAVTAGEFNCLSSAVLFTVAAEGLLDGARGMISRTHAFARVDVDARPVDVETTTPEGFGVDRDRLVTPAYLRQLGVGDGLSDAERLFDLRHPEEVTFTGLLAALYANRGVLLVRAGDVDAAAIAFDRATRLARGDQRARVAEWRAALLNNATQRLLDDDRADDAHALLVLALNGVAPGPTRDALLVNLATVELTRADRARAQGRFREARALLDGLLLGGALSSSQRTAVGSAVAELDGRIAAAEDGSLRCASSATPEAQARCFASSARALLDRQLGERALDDARRAWSLAPGDDVVAVTLHNALVAVLQAADKAGDCDRVEELAREASVAAAVVRVSAPLSVARVSGSCWWGRADAAAKHGENERAAAAYERARVHLPDEVQLRENLAVIALRQAEPPAQEGRCDDARPLLARVATVAPAGRLREAAAGLLELCANHRASQAAGRRDWASAVVELRRGLVDVPASELLAGNLRSMLHNHVVQLLAARRCEDARAALAELPGDSIVDDVQRVCAP